MALVNLKQMLNKAYKGKYAVLHVNVINYDMALTAIKAANETNSPIIIAVSQKALKGFAGTKDFSQMIEQIVKFENIKTSVAIHLDHGEYQTVMEAMKNGFTSVMYDGSKLPLQQNLKNIKIIVAYARKHNISVEGEVGTVPGKVEDRGASGQLANVLECQRLAATGIDALAAGIGNLHGNYPSNWKGLNFNRLKEIHTALPNLPLVLHGGSGIPNEQIRQAIKLGVCKMNIGTELLTAFTNELAQYFLKGKYKSAQGYDPRNYFPLGLSQTKKVVIAKIKLLGSFNKA